VNVAEVLRRELSRRDWRGETVAVGTATDPYQPAEGGYRLTRSCLEALAGVEGVHVSVVTKGTMIVRDMDLLQAIARHGSCSVCLSIPTADLAVWRALEPGTPSPLKRLEALDRLLAACARGRAGRSGRARDHHARGRLGCVRRAASHGAAIFAAIC